MGGLIPDPLPALCLEAEATGRGAERRTGRQDVTAPSSSASEMEHNSWPYAQYSGMMCGAHGHAGWHASAFISLSFLSPPYMSAKTPQDIVPLQITVLGSQSSLTIPASQSCNSHDQREPDLE